MTLKVGIIGKGFVGGTLFTVLSAAMRNRPDDLWVSVYDLDPSKGCASEAVYAATVDVDILFVCLPTPMDAATGRCHLDIVKQAIVKACARGTNARPMIVVKSTVPPGTTEKWNEEFGRVYFNPEFLTEANALNDFVSSEYQILGVPAGDNEADIYLFAKLFEVLSPDQMPNHTRVFNVPATAAEMVKYTRNCYLATRLSFFNEIKQVCDALTVDYNEVKYYAGLDTRVGNHYNRIDEQSPSFGGHCLPKDLNALINLANDLGVDPKVAKAVWAKNLEVAKVRDWESMEGRAVIKK